MSEDTPLNGAMFPQMAHTIARCRVIFSVLIAAAVLIDPMQPFLNPWVALGGDTSATDPDLLGVALVHLVYSLATYLALRFDLVGAVRMTAITTWTDVLFGAAVALVAGVTTGLFYYPFFTFAVVAAGLQTGFRRTMQVTALSVALWLAAILLASPQSVQLYVMRPVTLALVGYLVGYLGQRRLDLESEVRELETAEERLRIARELHDGCAQVLAGVNLQLEGCRDLVRNGRSDEALREMGELQDSVKSEYDELRAYVRSLAGVTYAPAGDASREETRFAVNVDIEGPGALVEQVFRIIREGIANVRRHAHASSAVVRAARSGPGLRISIDDDGRGFADGTTRPWSISSRVQALGGTLEIARDKGPGAHLEILLPAA